MTQSATSGVAFRDAWEISPWSELADMAGGADNEGEASVRFNTFAALPQLWDSSPEACLYQWAAKLHPASREIVKRPRLIERRARNVRIAANGSFLCYLMSSRRPPLQAGQQSSVGRRNSGRPDLQVGLP